MKKKAKLKKKFKVAVQRKTGLSSAACTKLVSSGRYNGNTLRQLQAKVNRPSMTDEDETTLDFIDDLVVDLNFDVKKPTPKLIAHRGVGGGAMPALGVVRPAAFIEGR